VYDDVAGCANLYTTNQLGIFRGALVHSKLG
jgi:hypothetical protein